MEQFFLPYIGFLYGAAYNIQQVFEGLGISSSNFLTFDNSGNLSGSYWSSSEAVILPFLFVLLYSIILFCLLLVSGYTIGRIKGVIVLLLILITPGLLQISGYWPQIQYLPTTYEIGGGGNVGSISGFLPLVVFGILSGWSLVVIAYDNLNLDDKFRNIFDHFWYTLAILVGVFFIVDSGINENVTKLKEENAAGRQASSYLLNQVKLFDSYCKSNNIEDTISCTWASDVQQSLNEYAVYDENVFYSVGPKSTKEIYSPIRKNLNHNDILALREQISAYSSKLCPSETFENFTKHSPPSGVCQRVPATFCRSFPEEPTNIADKYIATHTVALASECIVPTIVLSREIQEGLISKVEQDTKDKYHRWIYFIAFSFIVGGKVANVTTKLFALDNRPIEERRRILNLICRIYTQSIKILKLLVKILGGWMVRYFVRIVRLFTSISTRNSLIPQRITSKSLTRKSTWTN